MLAIVTCVIYLIKREFVFLDYRYLILIFNIQYAEHKFYIQC